MAASELLTGLGDARFTNATVSSGMLRMGGRVGGPGLLTGVLVGVAGELYRNEIQLKIKLVHWLRMEART